MNATRKNGLVRGAVSLLVLAALFSAPFLRRVLQADEETREQMIAAGRRWVKALPEKIPVIGKRGESE